MRVAAAWPAAALVAAATVAAGALVMEQHLVAQSSAKLPVALAAGTGGTTTLGASATSASTTGASLPLIGSTTVLHLQPGSQSWSVQVRAVSATTGLDTVAIAVGGVVQATVTAGALNPGPGTAVTLGTSVPVPITASGACVLTCSFQLRIVLSPVGGGPVIEYPYTLAVT